MNQVLNAIIVDDEQPARDELRYLLKSSSHVIEIIGEFDNTHDAYSFLESRDCDIMFLDIEMPVESGVEFVKRAEKNLENIPYIIFVTAYDRFAVDAFELNAIDYLLKPLRLERLEKALVKMDGLIESAAEFDLASLKNTNVNRNFAKMITPVVGEKLFPMPVEELIYASVVDKETMIYTLKGTFSYNKTLQSLEESLDPSLFFRTHKSYLINLNYIESIDLWFNGTYRVKLSNAKEMVPVSRNYSKTFKKHLNLT